jgi:2-polyprenyl-3-methyl-5-hydroxy-6-metoxy-1,4-benzoquinol methylase
MNERSPSIAMETKAPTATLEPTTPTQTAPAGTACPICSGTRLRRVFEVQTWSTYQIELCRNCGFVFAAPRPSAEELNRFYTSTYFTKDHDLNLGYANYRSVAEENARRMWHEFKQLLAEQKVVNRKLLDVGCATGGFLAEAKKDQWDGVGVEFSEFAIEVAKKEFGLNVLQGDVFHPELVPGSFGVVTMYHVLEHVIDPLATLKQSLKLLAPGGLLYVELPNWASVGRRARGVKWAQLKPPEHINFFTPKSLALAAKNAGFQVLSSSSAYPSLMNEAAVKRASQPLHQMKAAIASVASKLDCGGYARLLAVKA